MLHFNPWSGRDSKIDVKDLIDSVPAVRSPGTRIGWPDDPTPVYIADPQQFSTSLDNALQAFRDLRSGTGHLVSASINSYHRQVWIRFVERGPAEDRNGQVEPALEPAFRSLRTVTQKNGGTLHYWGGNNYFDVSLPFLGPIRENFPDVDHLPWDERYRHLLERASWESLRGMVFRFSNLAEAFATRCAEWRLSKVLIPSVGLCVHPWLFAGHGLSVTATDAAAPALAALSDPACWPRLYSRQAFERWDIAQCASYATQGNLDGFARMPNLEDREVRDTLLQRIAFTLSDWAALPVESGSIDAIFATNALPRDSVTDQFKVLKEWARVVRPGGSVFIAQHNFFNADIESGLRESGWVEANLLAGERPDRAGVTGFQIRYSSG